MYTTEAVTEFLEAQTLTSTSDETAGAAEEVRRGERRDAPQAARAQHRTFQQTVGGTA
jgi:hypothetical protein